MWTSLKLHSRVIRTLTKRSQSAASTTAAKAADTTASDDFYDILAQFASNLPSKLLEGLEEVASCEGRCTLTGKLKNGSSFFCDDLPMIRIPVRELDM